MSQQQFKAGDEVLVRAKWVRPDGDGDVWVSIDGEKRCVLPSDVLPVPVDPQPVDPSTLRVGDRVRAVRADESWSQTFEGTVIGFYRGVPILADYGLPASGRNSQWFLLDRPEPVDPRREAVRQALNDYAGTLPNYLTDRILTAIDGVTK